MQAFGLGTLVRVGIIAMTQIIMTYFYLFFSTLQFVPTQWRFLSFRIWIWLCQLWKKVVECLFRTREEEMLRDLYMYRQVHQWWLFHPIVSSFHVIIVQGVTQTDKIITWTMLSTDISKGTKNKWDKHQRVDLKYNILTPPIANWFLIHPGHSPEWEAWCLSGTYF